MQLTPLLALLALTTTVTAQGCFGQGESWGDVPQIDARAQAKADVKKWCNGDSHTDGSGGFARHQVKTGCYNLSHGRKVDFSLTNDANHGGFVSKKFCERMMKYPINNCHRGGKFAYRRKKGGSWLVKTDVNSGSC